MGSDKLMNLEDLFEHQIKDLHSAEEQLIEALPKMSKKVSSKDLKKAMDEHLKVTKKQFERINKVIEMLDIELDGETCKAMEGLIEEGEDFMEHKADDDVMDAGIIAIGQKIEHYEIAGYGTACYYAKQLKMTDALNLLKETLKEEKDADAKLNKIAKENVNPKAKEQDSKATASKGKTSKSSTAGSNNGTSAKSRTKASAK